MRAIHVGLLVLQTVAVFPSAALAQGKGEGGIVTRDGVTIYSKSKGSDSEISGLSRGFPVVGVTTMSFLSETFQFEQEDGRIHVWYLKKNDAGQYKSVQRRGWMNPDDVERFLYDCGCEAGAEAKRKCSPLAVSGMAARSWNACFMDGYSRKWAEMQSRGATAAPTPSSPASGSTASSAEKPITNDDVVALAKAGLGDELIVAKIQQAPREALNVSTEALLKLKGDGLSASVIQAMIRRAGQQH